MPPEEEDFVPGEMLIYRVRPTTIARYLDTGDTVKLLEALAGIMEKLDELAALGLPHVTGLRITCGLALMHAYGRYHVATKDELPDTVRLP